MPRCSLCDGVACPCQFTGGWATITTTLRSYHEDCCRCHQRRHESQEKAALQLLHSHLIRHQQFAFQEDDPQRYLHLDLRKLPFLQRRGHGLEGKALVFISSLLFFSLFCWVHTFDALRRSRGPRCYHPVFRRVRAQRLPQPARSSLFCFGDASDLGGGEEGS